MTMLLQVEDLTVQFRLPYALADLAGRAPRRMVQAVNGVSFALKRGETLGLVGESGCGKSTLGRAILRLVQPTSGKVLFEGDDVMELHRNELFAFRRRAQMVFQDPHASLNPKLTVEQTLSEALRVHHICPSSETSERVTRLMDRVGLSSDLAPRRPGALSGGQCQRVGVARALAVQPDLIIADESVSALDVSIQAQVLNLFMRLQREMNLTMIFISHDLGVVRHLCQTLAVMYLGRIVEFGPTVEIFRAPRHPYTQGLIEAIPRMEADARMAQTQLTDEPPSAISVPAGCAFHPRCPHAMAACCKGLPPAPRKVEETQVWCHLYAESATIPPSEQ